MKKIIALILAVATACLLVGCGAEKSDSFESQLVKEGKLIVATSPDYSPYEYYDENGQLVGFDVEAMEAIVGYIKENYNIELEWVKMDFSTIVSAVQLGQVDLGVSCFTYDPERDVLFSDSYLKSAQVVVVNTDSGIKTFDDLAGKTIGVQLGTTGEKAAADITGATLKIMNNYNQMFEVLKNDALNAIVCDEAVAVEYAKQGGFTVLEKKLIDEEVSVIAAKENTELMKVINEAIAKFVASEKYGELKTKFGV